MAFIDFDLMTSVLYKTDLESVTNSDNNALINIDLPINRNFLTLT